jgi:hypothetical protein
VKLFEPTEGRDDPVRRGEIGRQRHVVDIAHTQQRADVGLVRLRGQRIDEEEHASIARIATRAAICVSPAAGPERTSSTGSPIFRSIRRAVCRVAINEKCPKVSRLKVAQATRSTSCCRAR